MEELVSERQFACLTFPLLNNLDEARSKVVGFVDYKISPVEKHQKAKLFTIWTEDDTEGTEEKFH